MKKSADFVVVGGGIVGLATAFRLMEACTGAKIIVLEKENAPAQHQTGRNSGVIHSGIYYKPGSYKARNCIEGRELLVRFAQENNVLHDVCGKIIVATEDDEQERLQKIYKTGLENGLNGLKIIDGKEIREIEPFCAGIQGVWVPQTGIIDYPGVCLALKKLLEAGGNEILFGQEVKKISTQQGQKVIETKDFQCTAQKLIGCAGLQADRLARLDGLAPAIKIVGFRGDYYDLKPDSEHKVRNLIYPVPDPSFPFLGVHFTRMAKGGVECGPNAVFSFHREGYSTTAFNWPDAADALTYGGVWRLFAKHWQKGLDEYRRAFSKTRFLKTLQRLLPSLTAAEISPARCGIRAQALKPDGTLVDDFYFMEGENSLHVINAPSPAATACLAIGAETVKKLGV